MGNLRNPNVESTETSLARSGPPDNIKASPIPTKKNYGSKNNALIGSVVDIVMVLLNISARLIKKKESDLGIVLRCCYLGSHFKISSYEFFLIG